jgi:tetratricopeptide (TPR) repeat protein
MDHELADALKDHQAGRLGPAEAAYHRVVARDPANAVAHNLLGLVAHQRGDHPRAVALIGRATELEAGEPAFHANLAEVFRALGQPARAVACCEEALRLRPDFPGALNNLGLALQAMGRVAEAAERFREAVGLRADFAMAHNNLGNALRLLGETGPAVDHLRRAVALDPGLAEAHSNLGQLLLETYRRKEALAHCREAVRLRSGLAEARSNLGNVLRELGRLTEARGCYAEALRLNPGLATTWSNLGQALQDEGRFEEAIACHRRGLEIDPGSARIHANLAGALVDLEAFDEAEARYTLALRFEPGDADAQHGLGWVRHEQGRFEEAERGYREALRLKPGSAPALCRLGTLLEEKGDFRGAEESLRAALAHDPEHAGARAQLATLLRGALPDDDLAALGRLASDPDSTPGRRAALAFGLAHVLDARGDYAGAADRLTEANALALEDRRARGLGYDPEAHERLVDGLIASSPRDHFARLAGSGDDTDRPVFVVGLPRSGTTLTEQILAAHPEVFGAGELGLAGATFAALPRILGTDSPPVACAGRLDREATGRIARSYLARLEALDPRAPRIVDKMPENYLYLGLLATLFPRARFIHCRRDPRDVAVSCWMTNFRQIRWANDPVHIAGRFLAYERLMAHWRRVLPVPVMEVDYEETVDDLEGVARRLIRWIGLPWDPACLAFHEGRRPVRTASVSQVRQPIHRRSVGRWAHYEPSLGRLFARVRPASARAPGTEQLGMSSS